MATEVYGLVVCGGRSSRMGYDKSMLVYHGQPQRYYLYDMLQPLCSKVFISCNAEQVDDMNPSYEALPDMPSFENIGPLAGLLTAFTAHPGQGFLVLGCDYPYISSNDVRSFLSSIKKETPAAAFYNEAAQLYEPLLAWYGNAAAEALNASFKTGQYSLQHFLKASNAEKFYPGHAKKLTSIDTPDALAKFRSAF